jgi:triacylglycerol lipase
MLTASDYKELPVWSHAHDGSAPYRDFAFFRGRDENPMRLGSDHFQPVNAWWLMELCLLGYTGEEFATSELARIGFDKPRFFGDPGKYSAQALITGNDKCIFVIFRGTEQHRLADVIVDIEALPNFTKDGYVHAGFARALNRANCWTDIQAYLETLRGDRQLFFTGHSMGAGVVTIAAQQYRDVNPDRYFQLYTFGSPRVGGLTFKHRFGPFPSYRVVNDRDAVPHLPPPPVFWHVEKLVHIGPDGAPKNKNVFTGLRGAAAERTLNAGDYRLSRQERRQQAEEMLDPDSPSFDKALLRPISHHNPRTYATKMWNHYVWSEVHVKSKLRA